MLAAHLYPQRITCMKLPKTIPSILGPVVIKQGAETDKLLTRAGHCGSFAMDQREIRVHRKMPDCVQVTTLGHEIMHTVMEDSGLNNLVEDKLQEAICDAFGAWFYTAYQAGIIVLK
jgi:hypothetical protein